MESPKGFSIAGHVIIAGFGLPGRAVAGVLEKLAVPYCVLELNRQTVERAAKAGTHIVEGDVRDPQTLRSAGIDNARALIIAIPDEKAATAATHVARQLNPNIAIMSRTHYVSAGIEAHAQGANVVVVAEQVVAQEMSRRIEEMLSPAPAPTSIEIQTH